MDDSFARSICPIEPYIHRALITRSTIPQLTCGMMERVINPTCDGMNMNKIVGGDKGLMALATKLVAENPHTCVVETLLGMDGRSTEGNASGLRVGHLLVKTKHCKETLPGHGEAVRVDVQKDHGMRLWRVTAELAGF